MGGGGKSVTNTTTQIIQPTPPPQPSTADAIREYVASLPELFQAQLDFAPKEAAQQVALAQQYALPLAETAKEAQAAQEAEEREGPFLWNRGASADWNEAAGTDERAWCPDPADGLVSRPFARIPLACWSC